MDGLDIVDHASERPRDPLVVDPLAPVDAVGVHGKHDCHAVTSPPGNLCCRYTRVEPKRNSGMAQVVRSAGQGGGRLGRSQRRLSGFRQTNAYTLS